MSLYPLEHFSLSVREKNAIVIVSEKLLYCKVRRLERLKDARGQLWEGNKMRNQARTTR